MDDDACRLAAAFLPLIREADGDAIAARATTQTLTCPATSPDPNSDDVFAYAVARACEGADPGEGVEVYEWHNGKGPFYLTDIVDYAQQLSQAL